LASIGLDPVYARAFDEASWDAAIEERMTEAFALIGDEAGNAPVVGLKAPGAREAAMYGPILLRPPEKTRSLPLWDACVEMVTNPAFAGLLLRQVEILSTNQPDL
jgi:hypothetical protein